MSIPKLRHYTADYKASNMTLRIFDELTRKTVTLRAQTATEALGWWIEARCKGHTATLLLSE